MNELKDLLSELLCEMQGLNEVEIKELRKEWIDKLIEVGNKKGNKGGKSCLRYCDRTI